MRSEQVTGEDGNPFKIYYFRDDSMGFDPNDYEIGGKVKRVSFQEGSELAGLGDEENGTYYFEVNFNSDTRNRPVHRSSCPSGKYQILSGNGFPKQPHYKSHTKSEPAFADGYRDK